MAYKPKRQAAGSSNVLLTILKVCYLILVALCALVVILFIVYKTTVKPPELDPTDKVEITIQPEPTTNPDGTEDDTPAPTVTTIELTRKKDFHTFLLLGTDDGNGNADTIMVGAFDLKNNKISVVSVPRDTLVDVSRKIKKINSAYGMGGVDQMLDELKPILGFRPDHYITVDIQAFIEVVDELGGVNYYVPEDMFHEDGAGFTINLKEGQQLLNGHQALQLVRYRGYKNGSADLGRMQTQQKFIRQLPPSESTADNLRASSSCLRHDVFARYRTCGGRRQADERFSSRELCTSRHDLSYRPSLHRRKARL